MKMNNIRCLSPAIVLAVVVGMAAVIGAAEHLLLRGQGEEVVAVADLQINSGEISGILLNRTSRALSEVQLLVRYTWHWKNEFRPQEDTLSRAVYYTVEKGIPARGRVAFHYKPSEPLPLRPDGNFEVSVSIAGFTEIVH